MSVKSQQTTKVKQQLPRVKQQQQPLPRVKQQVKSQQTTKVKQQQQPLPRVKQQQQPLPKVKQQQQPLPKVKQQQLPKIENPKVSKTKSPKVPKKLTTKKIFDLPILSRNAKGLKKCDTRPGYCTPKTDSLFRKTKSSKDIKSYGPYNQGVLAGPKTKNMTKCTKVYKNIPPMLQSGGYCKTNVSKTKKTKAKSQTKTKTKV